jgi:hypothetical protein
MVKTREFPFLGLFPRHPFPMRLFSFKSHICAKVAHSVIIYQRDNGINNYYYLFSLCLMERSQKRLIDKVSSFFQRRWWRKPNRTTDQPQERLAAFVPEIETVTVPKPGTIIKQDSAVSVSSTNKTGHVFDGLNEDLQLPAVLTAPIVNLSLTESSENSSPLRRRSTQRRQSQISKQTFRQIRVPLQSESDSNSDVVSDLLHGVEAMNLKNKSTIRKSRTLLRNRRTSNKRYFSGVRQASELAAKLSECSFRSVSASEIKEVRQCLQNADHQ